MYRCTLATKKKKRQLDTCFGIPAKHFANALATVGVSPEIQSVVDKFKKMQVDRNIEANRVRARGLNPYKEEADSITNERGGRAAKKARFDKQAREDAIAEDSKYFASTAVRAYYGLKCPTDKFESKLKASTVSSTADVIVVRSLADANFKSLKKTCPFSLDVAMARLFGKRIALPEYLKGPGTFSSGLTSKFKPATACKRGLWITDEFSEKHRFYVGAITRALGVPKKLGWTVISETDFDCWEKAGKPVCKLDCLASFLKILLTDAVVDRRRSSRGTYITRE